MFLVPQKIPSLQLKIRISWIGLLIIAEIHSNEHFPRDAVKDIIEFWTYLGYFKKNY